MHCVFLRHLNCTIITPFLLTALYLTPWQFSPRGFSRERHSFLFIISFLFRQHNLSELRRKWPCLCLNLKLQPGDKNQSHFCHRQLFRRVKGSGWIHLWPRARSPHGVAAAETGKGQGHDGCWSDPKTEEFFSSLSVALFSNKFIHFFACVHMNKAAQHNVTLTAYTVRVFAAWGLYSFKHQHKTKMWNKKFHSLSNYSFINAILKYTTLP